VLGVPPLGVYNHTEGETANFKLDTKISRKRQAVSNTAK